MPDRVKEYQCRKINGSFELDGTLSDPAWQSVEWTDDFIDIRGGDFPEPRFRTRCKMMWDDDFLYIGALLEEPDVWGTLTEKNSIIYHDNDFEVFIDPDGDCENYYEFEVNALGTIWELTLNKPYNKGGEPRLGTNLDGLICKVHVDGEINNPNTTDKSWSVEIAFPWKGLKAYHSEKNATPNAGDTWRVNFSRVQWKHLVKNGEYERVPPHGTEIPWTEHPEDNWVWSPQGEINMHAPEHWGKVTFCE